MSLQEILTTTTDQMGRSVKLPFSPKKIICLVPSISELLWDLGLEEELIGITKFCIHPKEMFKTKTRVGGTKNIHFDRIEKLKPDLIIGNKEENTKEMIEELEKTYPVWMTDVNTFEESISMIEQIGKICNRNENAQEISSRLKSLKNSFEQTLSVSKPSSKVLYLIWKKPWMAVGKNTFIDEMLKLAGFENALENVDRYPELTEEDFKNLDVDYVFLSSEPYPFKEKHLEEVEALTYSSKAILVDGELFSWYGSRLLKSFPYFNNLRQQLSF
ncbi:MAG: cobalamin-binding protein [Saprospirales bacterium]|nr:MAG: cobalamin-binding protein [Saprospirales bacterium]